MMKRTVSLILSAVLLASTAGVFTSGADDTYSETDSCTYGITAGDVNGDGFTNMKDTARLIKYLAGHKVKIDGYVSDTNGDGKLSLKDVSKLTRYFAGWPEIRLCHADTSETVNEATETSFGLSKLTCSRCQSCEYSLLPKLGNNEHFTVNGVPLSEYTIVYGECPGREDLVTLAHMLDDALYRIAGVDLKCTSASNSVNEHEIILGSCDRDILPEFEVNTPAAGICEDGTIYFYAYTSSMIRYLIDTFLDDAFGTEYCDSFGATSGRTDILRNPWGNSMDGWEFEIDTFDLDAEGYKLVFEDNFDGDELDMDAWTHRATGQERDGVNDPGMVSLEDGNLVIRGEYVENGPYGDKWHAGMIALNEWYARGYMEIKAKCVDPSYGFWSAFWIQGASPYKAEDSQGGIGPGGAELDILENNCSEGMTNHNVYCAGVNGIILSEGDTFSAYNSGEYFIGDIINEYHTYALEWDEDWYTFYVDGIMVGRTNFGDGTSVSPEQIILSVEISSNMPSPDDSNFNEIKEKKTAFYVDYLRIWQK